ncbi:MAG: RDD family protein [Bacilli bacterium]
MKNRYILKRIMAYIFDYSLVSILVGLILVSSSMPYIEKISKIVSSSADPSEIINQLEPIMNSYLTTSGSDALNILLIYIVYYVLLAKFLKDRTVGSYLVGLKFIKNQEEPLSYSDLTVRMLFTNSGFNYLMMGIIFILLYSNTYIALLLFSLTSLGYGIFVITNFIMLLTTQKTLVDRMTKTIPKIIIKA